MGRILLLHRLFTADSASRFPSGPLLPANMITVASLLNPLPPPKACSSFTSSKFSTSDLYSRSMLGARRRVKMSKPTSLLIKASPTGIIRYPPCEVQDDVIRAAHQDFQVQSICKIKEFPRHIPYNSDKKTFQEKTGRDAFEGEHEELLMKCLKLTSNSISLYLSNARRPTREGTTRRHVGLQRWLGPNHFILQKFEASEGLITNGSQPHSC